MKILFVIKPFVSRSRSQLFFNELSVYRSEQRRQGGTVHDVVTTAGGERSARAVSERAVRQGYDRIVIVGGDGLLHEGLNGVMTAVGKTRPLPCSLGLVPAGTGNDFAKALFIPPDVKEAFQILRTGTELPVDVGRVNDHYFINSLSFGIDAVINETADRLKRTLTFLPKPVGYLAAAVKEVCSGIRDFDMVVEYEDGHYRGKADILAITNGHSYGAMFMINPSASITDGVLNVCIIEPVGTLRALYYLYRSTRGTHVTLPGVTLLRLSSALTVSSPFDLPCEADGEVVSPGREFSVRIIPAVLPFIVP